MFIKVKMPKLRVEKRKFTWPKSLQIYVLFLLEYMAGILFHFFESIMVIIVTCCSFSTVSNKAPCLTCFSKDALPSIQQTYGN